MTQSRPLSISALVLSHWPRARAPLSAAVAEAVEVGEDAVLVLEHPACLLTRLVLQPLAAAREIAGLGHPLFPIDASRERQIGSDPADLVARPAGDLVEMDRPRVHCRLRSLTGPMPLMRLRSSALSCARLVEPCGRLPTASAFCSAVASFGSVASTDLMCASSSTACASAAALGHGRLCVAEAVEAPALAVLAVERRQRRQLAAGRLGADTAGLRANRHRPPRDEIVEQRRRSSPASDPRNSRR